MIIIDVTLMLYSTIYNLFRNRNIADC